MTRASSSLGLIVNANAGRVKRRYLPHNRFWERLLPESAVRITHAPADLHEAVPALKAQDVRVVACLGGDGTLHYAIEAMIHHYGEDQLPLVLPLGGGTLNGVAHALGTGGVADTTLSGAMDAIERDAAEIRTQSLLRIRNACNGNQHFGFTFAAGLAARAAKRYYNRTNPGLIDVAATSLLPVTTAIFGGEFYAPVALDLRIDGEPLSGETHTVVAGVLANPFLWFRPFGNETCGDAQFHVVAASMRPAEIAMRLWKIFRGRCDHPGISTGRANAVSLRWSEGFVIDGELFSQHQDSDIRISMGPAIQFLCY